MKLKLYFPIVVIVLSTINVNVYAQKRVVENAIKVATLVPAVGVTSCKMDTKPCAVTNKAADRTITVRVEASYLFNNEVRKKTVTLDRIAPSENRYIGCAGCANDGAYGTCTGYKIVLAYYDEPDSVRVRALFYDKPGNAITSR